MQFMDLNFFPQGNSTETHHSMLREGTWLFFPIEALLRAEKGNINIVKLPVTWTYDSRTKVKFFRTIYNYIVNINNLRKSLKK